MDKPAEHLLGLSLDDGWRVVSKIERGDGHTGSNFSCGYTVEKADGGVGFLKAIDLSSALKSANMMPALYLLTSLYNHECTLLDICRAKKLSRVATPLSTGYASVPEGGQLAQVPYIVFELAKCDSRAFLNQVGKLEVGWRLRSLHHVATGIQQLHRSLIAHQDLKPSNVLIFEDNGSKVADLGTASQHGIVSPVDGRAIAGDPNYAPPELMYGEQDPDWKARRLGVDLYLFGSLIYFFFTDASLTHVLISRLPPQYRPSITMQGNRGWGGTYRQVLPVVQAFWEEIIQEFACELDAYSGAPKMELCQMVKYLTEPAPDLRGHPLNRRNDPYSLERFITKLDRLAHQHGL
jgi:serine/threonine protein kinase